MVYYLGGKDGNEGGAADEFERWQRLYLSDENGLTCEEKFIAAASVVGPFPLKSMLPYDLGFFKARGKTYKKVQFKKEFTTSRARWMFVSVGACRPNCVSDVGCASSVEVEYWLNFSQSGKSRASRYFSADRSGELQMCVIFCALYAILAVAAYRVRKRLMLKGKYHHTVKLVITSVTLEFTSWTCALIGSVFYASSGEEAPVWSYLDLAFQGFVSIFLLAEVMLVAKGWTIVRRKISAMGRVRLGAYLTAYFVAYWACLVYYVYGVDYATSLFIYDTGAGYAIAAMRAVCFLWLTRSVRLTVLKYKSKKAFYRKFWMLAGAWLITLPLCVLLGSTIDGYYRNMGMTIITSGADFLLLFALVFMYNPHNSRSRSFPFHATTRAMLFNSDGPPSNSAARLFAGANSFTNSDIRRASDIASRLKSCVRALNSDVSDLTDFLDDLDPAKERVELIGASLPSPSSTARLRSRTRPDRQMVGTPRGWEDTGGENNDLMASLDTAGVKRLNRP